MTGRNLIGAVDALSTHTIIVHQTCDKVRLTIAGIVMEFDVAGARRLIEVLSSACDGADIYAAGSDPL